MLDFTSALYLGLKHASAELPEWQSLSTGRPAALGETEQARSLGGEVAQLQGCEAGVVLPSTLHLFWDLFDVLARQRIAVLGDGGAYPIARWGMQRAAARGSPVTHFAHHDSSALRHALEALRSRPVTPVIVADAFCASCGQPAPVTEYSALARTHGGYLVLDDTQALGVLGAGSDLSHPLGRGGGGSLRFHGEYGPHLVVGCSLAKAFGAPIAVLSGASALIEHFLEHSETRVYSSPPSQPAIAAGQCALRVNEAEGDSRRARLARLVERFRAQLSQLLGMQIRSRARFPVMHVPIPEGRDASKLHAQLLEHGIRAVLTRRCQRWGAQLTFLLTALHRLKDIELAATRLRDVFATSTSNLTVGW